MLNPCLDRRAVQHDCTCMLCIRAFERCKALMKHPNNYTTAQLQTRTSATVGPIAVDLRLSPDCTEVHMIAVGCGELHAMGLSAMLCISKFTLVVAH